ncbi:MAG: hypothetical protein HN368_15585 [Spirochaetales bacterium]|jgi:hypothetical protein|nr:hypothetical protein [Spirochaetales bacterium]
MPHETLVYEMGRQNLKKGIATLCIGGEWVLLYVWKFFKSGGADEH